MKLSPFAISPLDSQRFGYTIIRGTVGDESPHDYVLASLIAFDADIAIFRCPAGDIGQVRNLIHNGYLPIHADTLVYYSRALSPQLLPAEVHVSGVDASLARPEEQQAIADIARLSFSNYRSHYLANPLLDSKLVLEGYTQWAQAHLASQHTNKDTWVVRVKGRVCGFATCSIAAEASSIEIVLNAVAPAVSGQGLYGHLLNAIIRHYGREGLASLVISTQVWNYQVQRAWSRAGLTLHLALDTYHVNANRDLTDA